MTVLDLMKVPDQILILGDTIVDKTWYVKVSRLSPEAPIPVANLITEDPVLSPGGASLAAYYAKQQSIPSIFLTTTDVKTSSWLKDRGVKTISILSQNHISKERYIDKESNYHLLRVDNDFIANQSIVCPEEINQYLTAIKSNIAGIVILDYRKGMLLKEETCKEIISFARQKQIPTYVDTRGNIENFKGINYLKLNEKEYVAACAALNVNSKIDLARKLEIDNLIITLSKEGAEIEEIKENKYYKHSPNLSLFSGVPDVTGCGDVFDINFCYYRFIKNFSSEESLMRAVEKATTFAYQPIGERLC